VTGWSGPTKIAENQETPQWNSEEDQENGRNATHIILEPDPCPFAAWDEISRAGGACHFDNVMMLQTHADSM